MLFLLTIIENRNTVDLYLNHLDAKYSKIDYMKRKKFTKYAQTKNEIMRELCK